MQAKAAEQAEQEKLASANEQKATHRTQVLALSKKLASEDSIVVELQRYHASLEERLRNEALQVVQADVVEGAGKRGLQIVEESSHAVRAYLSELRQRLAKSKAALDEERARHEKEARRVEADLNRSREQKAAIADALQKMCTYEKNLSSNLTAPSVQQASI